MNQHFFLSKEGGRKKSMMITERLEASTLPHLINTESNVYSNESQNAKSLKSMVSFGCIFIYFRHWFSIPPLRVDKFNQMSSHFEDDGKWMEKNVWQRCHIPELMTGNMRIVWISIETERRWKRRIRIRNALAVRYLLPFNSRAKDEREMNKRIKLSSKLVRLSLRNFNIHVIRYSVITRISKTKISWLAPKGRKYEILLIE